MLERAPTPPPESLQTPTGYVNLSDLTPETHTSITQRLKNAGSRVVNALRPHTDLIPYTASAITSAATNGAGVAMKFIYPPLESVMYTAATFAAPSVGRSYQTKRHPEDEITISENHPVRSTIAKAVNTMAVSIAFSYVPIVATLGPGWPAFAATCALQTVTQKPAYLLDKAEDLVINSRAFSVAKAGLFSLAQKARNLCHRDTPEEVAAREAERQTFRPQSLV